MWKFCLDIADSFTLKYSCDFYNGFFFNDAHHNSSPVHTPLLAPQFPAIAAKTTSQLEYVQLTKNNTFVDFQSTLRCILIYLFVVLL